MASGPHDPLPSTTNEDEARKLTRARWLALFYFSLRGRISRKAVWLFFILPVAVAFVLYWIVVPDLAWISLAVLVLLWPSFAVQVKRLHDANLSGWWMLTYLIPILGPPAAPVVICLIPGTVGANRFGDDPRANHVTAGPRRASDTAGGLFTLLGGVAGAVLGWLWGLHNVETMGQKGWPLGADHQGELVFSGMFMGLFIGAVLATLILKLWRRYMTRPPKQD